METTRPKHRLFVYGTLAPGESNHWVLADLDGHWQPGSVRATLYPPGTPPIVEYPVIELDDHAGPVHGLLFTSDQLSAHWPRIDNFEGSEYSRTVAPVTLADGAVTHAHVYVLNSR